MKTRGFTLVELIVVVVLMIILGSVITAGYVTYINRAADGQANALTKSVITAAERYYNTNQEYPTSTLLAGGSTPPSAAAYTTMSTVLESQKLGLNDGTYKLFPCSGTCTVPYATGDYVHYLTKGAASGTAKTYAISGTGCIVTFPTSENDGESYVIVYKKKENGYLTFHRSANGGPTTNDNFYCPFSG